MNLMTTSELPTTHSMNDGQVLSICRCKKGKSKEAGFVQCPIVKSSPLKRSGMDHTVFTLQLHHTCLYPVKHSPDGAITDSDNSHLIAAYYSFIDPERMKG